MKGYLGGQAVPRSILVQVPTAEDGPRVLQSTMGADPKWETLEDVAHRNGYALVPLDRIKTCSAQVSVPINHLGPSLDFVMHDLSRTVADEVGRQMMRFNKFTERDSRLGPVDVRVFESAVQIIVPKADEIPSLVAKAREGK